MIVLHSFVGWLPYDKTINALFERAKSHGINVLPFVRNGVKYIANLHPEKMNQRRNDGKYTTERAIRRHLERHVIPHCDTTHATAVKYQALLKDRDASMSPWIVPPAPTARTGSSLVCNNFAIYGNASHYFSINILYDTVS